MVARIEEVADPVRSPLFHEAIAVRNAVLEHEFGTADATDDPAELTGSWQDEHEPKRLLVAVEGDRVVGDRVVGCAIHETRRGSASEAAWIEAWVLPSERGRGVGGVLWDGLLDLCARSGNLRALAYAPAGSTLAEDDEASLTAASGVGAIRSDVPGTRFLARRGARLEQVVRMSRFALPPRVDLDSVLAAAADAAAGYRIRTWTGRTPAEHEEALAHLLTRMSTEAPTAGLEEPEDVWTVERLREREMLDEGSATTTLTALAVEQVCGEAAGFTQLSVPRREDRPVFQGDTLVLKEHRGRRLGMLLKAANLRRLATLGSAHPAVVTWNAEENRPMLDVNEAVGFVPIGYEGAWRLDLE